MQQHTSENPQNCTVEPHVGATVTIGMAIDVVHNTEALEASHIAPHNTDMVPDMCCVLPEGCPPADVASQDADRRASAGMATTSCIGAKAAMDELSALLDWQMALELKRQVIHTLVVNMQRNCLV